MLKQKLKEVIISVLPITIIVLLLNFTVVPIGINLVGRFIVGAILIILGLSIFLFGVDLGIQPIGTLMGESITKSKKLWIVLVFGLFLVFVNVAEPICKCWLSKLVT